MQEMALNQRLYPEHMPPPHQLKAATQANLFLRHLQIKKWQVGVFVPFQGWLFLQLIYL
jgi:hypothetical protein